MVSETEIAFGLGMAILIIISLVCIYVCCRSAIQARNDNQIKILFELYWNSEDKQKIGLDILNFIESSYGPVEIKNKAGFKKLKNMYVNDDYHDTIELDRIIKELET